jgi:uncharacterized membrane protein
VLHQTNGSAVASIVLGIVGLVISAFPIVGLVLGVLAIAFAHMGFNRAEVLGTGRGFAIAGLVLGVIATVVGLLVLVVFREVVDQVGRIRDSRRSNETECRRRANTVSGALNGGRAFGGTQR